MNLRVSSIFPACSGLVLTLGFATSAYGVARFVPTDFATIQAAIDASTAGDVVTVETGTYAENLTLKSGVDVRGREAARTFVEAADPANPVVTASGADLITFGNFTIANAQIAIDIVDSTNLQVVNTIIDTATQFGLRATIDSQADILNGVFRNNAVAISRATVDVQITNTGFDGNTVTVSSPIGLVIDPNTNVENSGFFANADLVVGGVDTGLGTNSVVGDPRFVDPPGLDFHLREGSPFIDTGVGNDSIDNTLADIGAYGGQFADPFPFPLAAPDVVDSSGAAPPPYSVDLTWNSNLGYLVLNSVNAGSYRVYYQQNMSGPPYSGTDAGNGTLPSPVEAGDMTTLALTGLQPVAPAPDAPQLLSAEPRDAAVLLTWSAVAEAGAYRVHWGVASVDENVVDVGDVVTYAVTGLDNGTVYLFAVSGLRQPVYHFSVTALDNTQNRNESAYSPESTVALGPLTEGQQSNQLSASPAVTVPYPDLPDKGCFVATAAFGANWAAEVQVLRDFRDRYLETSRPGRVFVDWYYQHGPAAARFIDSREPLKALVRAALMPLVVVALVLPGLSPLVLSLLAALVAILAASISRRRLSFEMQQRRVR